MRESVTPYAPEVQRQKGNWVYRTFTARGGVRCLGGLKGHCRVIHRADVQ